MLNVERQMTSRQEGCNQGLFSNYSPPHSSQFIIVLWIDFNRSCRTQNVSKLKFVQIEWLNLKLLQFICDKNRLKLIEMWELVLTQHNEENNWVEKKCVMGQCTERSRKKEFFCSQKLHKFSLMNSFLTVVFHCHRNLLFFSLRAETCSNNRNSREFPNGILSKWRKGMKTKLQYIMLIIKRIKRAWIWLRKNNCNSSQVL